MSLSAHELARRLTLESWKREVLDPPKSRARLLSLSAYCAERSDDLANDRIEYTGASRRFRMLADYFAELAEGAEEA